jgi:hypothetical protein
VAQIATVDEVNALLEANDVVFLLYNPKNDEKLAGAFNTVATELQAKGTFAATSSAEVVKALKLDVVDSADGFLVRLEQGQRPLYFTGGSLTDDNVMLEFADKHNHPFLNHLTQFNYRSLSSKGKTMSMLLVNYDDPTHKQAIQLFKSAAESLGEEGMNRYVCFAAWEVVSILVCSHSLMQCSALLLCQLRVRPHRRREVGEVLQPLRGCFAFPEAGVHQARCMSRSLVPC